MRGFLDPKQRISMKCDIGVVNASMIFRFSMRRGSIYSLAGCGTGGEGQRQREEWRGLKPRIDQCDSASVAGLTGGTGRASDPLMGRHAPCRRQNARR